MFWFADGGWARDKHIHQLAGDLDGTNSALGNSSHVAGQSSTAAVSNSTSRFSLPAILRPVSQTLNMSSGEPFLFSLVKKIFRFTIQPGQLRPADNSTSATAELISRRYDSILSDIRLFQTMTPSPTLNRVIVDILEGLMITLSVVVAFILVFLIREWVVQQQPMMNLQLAHANHALEAQDQAGQAVQEAQPENAEQPSEAREELTTVEETLVDQAPNEPGAAQRSLESRSEARQRAENTIAQLPESIRDVVQQGRVTEVVGLIANLPDDERTQVKELITKWSQAQKEYMTRAARDILAMQESPEETVAESSSQAAERTPNQHPRPAMPTRERSFVATEIQRTLEEDQHSPNSNSYEEGEEDDQASSNVHPSTSENVPDSWEDELLPDTNTAQKSPKGKEKATTSRPDLKKLHTSERTTRIPRPKSSLPQSQSVRQALRQRASAPDVAAGNVAALPEALSDAVAAMNGGISPTDALESSISSLTVNAQSTSGGGGGDDGDVAEFPRDEIISGADLLVEVTSSEGDRPSTPHPDTGLVLETPLDTSSSSGIAIETPGTEPEQPPLQQDDAAVEPQTLLARLMEYFYGDLAGPPTTNENADEDEEHVVQDIEDEAPFVPFEDAQPAPQQPELEPPAPQPANQGQDPEVAAAAAQAGIDINDQDAIDDAEDLEGILELIGMQGPLTGLFQNALFSAVLISLTVATAVWFPYTWGKTILLFLGSPIGMWFEIPLMIIGAVEGFVADVALFFIGAVWYYTGAGITFLYKLVMRMDSSGSLGAFVGPAKDIMGPAWQRLGNMTLDAQWPADADYLHASIASHAALKNIEASVVNSLASVGNSTANLYTEAISRSPLSAAHLFYTALITNATALYNYLNSVKIDLAFLWRHAAGPMVTTGTSNAPNVTLTSVPGWPPLEASLAFWSASDRTLAVLIGYLSFALIGCIYLSWSPPLFSEGKVRQVEQTIIEVLTQAGGVCKVILIISIEMIAFPLFCGFLLDLALLPLFEDASVASRVSFAIGSPWTSGFVHWFVGTCYMFHFALFVSMCRKIMRTGVLYFIRDPDDPTFHPVRDVLERSVATQLRKIAFSAIVYGALIVLCLGGVVWGLWAVLDNVLPLHWSSSKSSLEFPLDILFYNFLTPLIVKSARPSDGLHAMYKWWFRRCARFLRLSDFLFGERQADEEGHHVRKTWRAWFLRQKASQEDSADRQDRSRDVRFQKDGRYVRAPSSDQVRIPKGEAVFVEVNEDNTRKDDKPNDEGVHAADSAQTKMVYIPPWFGARISAFVLTIWFFAALTGCGITVIPLLAGRWMCQCLSYARTTGSEDKRPVNDIYAFSLGIYTLGGLLYFALHFHQVRAWVMQKLQTLKQSTWSSSLLNRVVRTTASCVLRVARIVYVYGALIVVLPLVFTAILELYVLIPLLSLSTHPADTQHTIHLIQDWTLGILYVRIAARIVMWDRESVLARAARAVTAEGGYLDPSAKLATRYFIFPATLIFSFLLLVPLGMATALNATLHKDADEDVRVMCMRLQYPALAGAAVLGWATVGVGRRMERWRGRIRDEVYLIGERLHNFGERRVGGTRPTHASATANVGA